MKTQNYGVIELDSKTLNDVNGGCVVCAALALATGIAVGVAIGYATVQVLHAIVSEE